jgi:hypothetical protein
MSHTLRSGLYAQAVLGFFTKAALSAVLICFPATVSAQLAGQTDLRCGTRSTARYGIVLDASSSLSTHGTSAETAYSRILRVLAESLCRTDQPLRVYAFPEEYGTLEGPVASLRPGTGLVREVPVVSRLVLSRGSRHTDLDVVVSAIERLFTTDTLDAVILVTDGSYYPAGFSPDSATLHTVLARLNSLYETAARLRENRMPLHVIGLHSDQAHALDQQLVLRAPLDPADWIWEPGDTAIDLTTASGSALLRTVFGNSFHRQDEEWVPAVLFDGSYSVWRARLGYESSVGLRLAALRAVSLEHLVFLPADGTECITLKVGMALQFRRTASDGSRRQFCSLENPDAAVIDSLIKYGVQEVVFRQRPVFELAQIPQVLYGYYQIAVAEPGKVCAPETVRDHFLNGGAWPPSRIPRAWAVLLPQTLTFHDSATASFALPSDTLALVSIPGTDCLIPDRNIGEPWRAEGPHLLWVHRDTMAMLQRVELRKPRVGSSPLLRVLPGGFPPNSAAWVRICADVTEVLGPDQSVGLAWAGRNLFLGRMNSAHSHSGCTEPGSHRFSSVVRIASLKPSGYLFIGSETDPLTHITTHEWYPVLNSETGMFLMPWRYIILLVFISVCGQLIYWRWASQSADRHDESQAKRITRRGCTIFRVIIFTLVISELITCWFVLDRSGVTPIPWEVIVAMVLYGIKLTIAFMLPELIEDSLF